jgi:hypothetical protein
VATEPRQGDDQADREMVWEVEVETEALAKLIGAFVGFLSEPKERHVIQQIFFMDGYHNIKVPPWLS